MSQGSTGYESFVRIHAELGEPNPPPWTTLPHLQRLAWEAAAQAIAMSVLRLSLGAEKLFGLDEDAEDEEDESDEDVIAAGIEILKDE